MRAGRGQNLTAEPTGDRKGAQPREWVVAAILYGLMLVEGLRQGGFWRADAFVAAVAAVGLLLASIFVAPPDRRSWWAIVSVVSLALWWLIRAQTSGSLTQFLPLGASFLAFAAGFAAVRPLKDRARVVAGLSVACLGAVGALVGFAGLIWRWYPMAMPAQGLWRLSTTLTYSDAAGLVLGACLLIALGTDLYPALVRMAVCLCAGGLLATQSRGAYAAVACACCLVPWRRYVRYLVPLIAGAGLGVAAIVTSPDTGRVPWLGAALILASGIAAVAGWEGPSGAIGVPAREELLLWCSGRSQRRCSSCTTRSASEPFLRAIRTDPSNGQPLSTSGGPHQFSVWDPIACCSSMPRTAPTHTSCTTKLCKSPPTRA